MTVAGDYIGRVRLGVTIGAAGDQSFTWPAGRPAGTYTADAGADGAITLTVTEVGDDALTVAWAAGDSRLMIGHPWRVLRDGTWVFGDLYVTEAEPTDNDPAEFTVLDGTVEVTVAMVAPSGDAGTTVHEELTGRNDPEQHTSDAIEVSGYDLDLTTVLTALGGSVAATAGDLVTLAGTVNTIGSDLNTAETAIATEVTTRGTAVTNEANARIAADVVLANATKQAEDRIRAEALARLATDPLIQVGLPEGSGGGWSDGAYTTPAPASFTSGMWVRFTVTPLAIAPDVDGTNVFTSPFVWKAEAADGWYTVRVGVQRIFDGAADDWRLYLYAGITEDGGTDESIVMSTSTNSGYPPWEMPLGAPTECAVWLDCSNGDGVWELRFLARTHFGTADLSVDGAEWTIVARSVGAAAATVASSAQPWTVGHGHGELRLDGVQIRDDGPAGTMLANPTAALAAVAGEGAAFTDAQANTWTPGPDALVHYPIRPTVEMDGGEVSSHTAAVRVTDTNAAFILPTLTEADHGRQLWFYVPTVTGGTLDEVTVDGAVVEDYDLTADSTVLLVWYGIGTGYWFVALDTATLGGGGAVDSVNGDTGTVVLEAADVGAIASTLPDAKGDLIAASAADTPARLAVGTNGQLLTAASGETTGLAWASATNGVRKIARDAYLWDTISGSQTWTVDTATAQGGGFVGGEAINDYTEWVEWLDAGTWTLELWHITSTSNGVMTIALDGAALGATVDGYTGSTTRNNRVTRTGVVVATSGTHTLRVSVLSKNGSSSGYRSGVQAYAFRRTA